MKIALYGLYFDTGKADVKPESQPQLAESWEVAGDGLSITFKYYAVPLVSLDLIFGAAGTASLDANVALTAQSGAGVAPFNTSQKIGAVNGAITSLPRAWNVG